jgi:hypothetical protein
MMSARILGVAVAVSAVMAIGGLVRVRLNQDKAWYAGRKSLSPFTDAMCFINGNTIQYALPVDSK